MPLRHLELDRQISNRPAGSEPINEIVNLLFCQLPRHASMSNVRAYTLGRKITGGRHFRRRSFACSPRPFGPDGSPDFPLVCERMLMRHRGIPITYVVFDLLSLDGRDLTGATYSKRRSQLEALKFDGTYCQTPETFDDGHALLEAVCAHELEGVMAKRKDQPFPGDRGCVKIKNREYWRYELERESVISKRRERVFV
jgi:hypothetical protein